MKKIHIGYILILVAASFVIFKVSVNGKYIEPKTVTKQSYAIKFDHCSDDSEAEKSAIFTQSKKIKRINKHELQVRWEGGTKIFRDKVVYERNSNNPNDPPVEMQNDGNHWVYCGYNAELKLHHFTDNNYSSDFSGILFNEKTGKSLPGGTDVYFSYSKNLYYAYEQPDGLDGIVINLFDISGKKLWSGFNYIPRDDDKYIMVATLREIHWTDQNVIQAQAACLPELKKETTVTLVETQGKWSWQPTVKCP